jgi:glycosyltransferase involved in cell wall biosynthesis
VRVSLILTVKNEADALPRLLGSMAAQTRAPDEIVVVEGGSTDGTLDLLRAHSNRLPLKILSLPGANISQGRNAAIQAATGDIICSTDAGVRLDESWIEELVKPLEKDEGGGRKDEKTDPSFNPHSLSFDVVAGFFVPDPHGVFETALAATTLPALEDIRSDKFLPSSRSIAFRKSAWEAVHGYPEWLDYCEDLIFDLALRACNFRFTFAPRALVHFRPRPNLSAFFRQYYQYARGDGKANLWFSRHVIRYLTYLVALPTALFLLRVVPPVGFGVLLFAFLVLFFTPYKRLRPRLDSLAWSDKLRAIMWVPVIRVGGDIAKMIGYPVGVGWRMRRNPIDPHWQERRK